MKNLLSICFLCVFNIINAQTPTHYCFKNPYILLFTPSGKEYKITAVEASNGNVLIYEVVKIQSLNPKYQDMTLYGYYSYDDSFWGRIFPDNNQFVIVPYASHFELEAFNSDLGGTKRRFFASEKELSIKDLGLFPKGYTFSFHKKGKIYLHYKILRKRKKIHLEELKQRPLNLIKELRCKSYQSQAIDYSQTQDSFPDTVSLSLNIPKIYPKSYDLDSCKQFVEVNRLNDIREKYIKTRKEWLRYKDLVNRKEIPTTTFILNFITKADDWAKYDNLTFLYLVENYPDLLRDAICDAQFLESSFLRNSLFNPDLNKWLIFLKTNKKYCDEIRKMYKVAKKHIPTKKVG